MSAHTKEPWCIGLCGTDAESWPIEDESGYVHITDAHPDDARRIVACVNACAEMSTEYLEQCGKMRKNEAGESIAQLIGQRDDERKKHEACVTINERLLSDIRILTERRDELLSALAQCASALEYESGKDHIEILANARAALAKVKQ